MKVDDRVTAVENELGGLREELGMIRRFLEAQLPALQIEKGERDRRAEMAAMMAIAKLPVAERVAKLRAMAFYDRRKFWGYAGGFDAIVETLRACDLKLRTDLIETMTDAQRDDLATTLRAPEPRIEAKLAPHVRGKVEPTDLGRDYVGVYFDANSFHVETRVRWQRRLQVDHTLGDHVARGTIVVRDLTDDESRRHAQLEELQLPPDQRPRLDPSALDEQR